MLNNHIEIFFDENLHDYLFELLEKNKHNLFVMY